MSSRSQRHRKCKVEQILSENELSESDDDDDDDDDDDPMTLNNSAKNHTL